MQIETGTFALQIASNTMPILLDQTTGLYAILGTCLANVGILWFEAVSNGAKWCEGAGTEVPVPEHFAVLQIKEYGSSASDDKKALRSKNGHRFCLNYKLDFKYTLMYRNKVVLQLFPRAVWKTIHYTEIEPKEETAADAPLVIQQPETVNVGGVEVFVAMPPYEYCRNKSPPTVSGCFV